jgi:hypothetical protein
MYAGGGRRYRGVDWAEEPMMTEETRQGLTRREVLKKGAMLGGTVLWVVPVVQAVGMSPAMAQVPSETSCCLNFVSLSATYQAADTVRLTAEFFNCSTHRIDDNVIGNLERLQWDGAPMLGTEVAIDNTAFNTGAISPGDADTDGYTDGLIPRPATGDYVYRSHATYDCYEGQTLIQADLSHNIPAAFWVYSNPVTIPAPS